LLTKKTRLDTDTDERHRVHDQPPLYGWPLINSTPSIWANWACLPYYYNHSKCAKQAGWHCWAGAALSLISSQWGRLEREGILWDIRTIRWEIYYVTPG